MRNRLSDSSSPYLRQHAKNPVAWQPWDDEAFEEARARDVPVFLSIGYSSCHWCHVMEHESFENPEIAAALNEGFVSIKVDREELPDIDDAYMTAVHLSRGQGGWPMSVFMTPAAKPFFAGTYFPPEDRGQYLGFASLVREVANAWKNDRQQLMDAADDLSDAVRSYRTSAAPTAGTQLSWEWVDAKVEQVMADLRATSLSSSAKPKFPPHTAIALLLWMAEHRNRSDCRMLAVEILSHMMRGGIHDHIGGGFHRYSTDAEWVLPHFEKMLYDNALLLSNYANAARLTGSTEFRYVADKIVAWLNREMKSREGAYFCATDADSEGEEGIYYTWSQDEVMRALGPQEGPFCEQYNIREEGNHLDEATRKPTYRNVPFVSSGSISKFQAERGALLEVRSRRVPPAVDEKLLATWNGLAISGLVAAGEHDLARRCADYFIRSSELRPSMTSTHETWTLDMSYLVQGVLDLFDASEVAHYREVAAELQTKLAQQFHDENTGGWYFNPKQKTNLFGNPKPVFDSPLPSPNSIAISNALRLGKTEQAARDMTALQGWIDSAPTATESLLHTAAKLLQNSATEHQDIRFEVRFEQSTDTAMKAVIAPILPTGWKLVPLGEDGRLFKVLPEGVTEEVNGELVISGSPTSPSSIEVTFSLCTDRICLPAQAISLEIPWQSPNL
ncbi:MAG: thioredoxin domain-containing protein [Fimbriimonadales bacterium]